MTVSTTEDITQDFEKNKYVVLKDFVPASTCKVYSSELFLAKAESLTVRDKMCPLSDSIYKADFFKELQDSLIEPLSYISGKKLKPSFNYARIYNTGEVLEKHKDRPACEYSISMTLGHAKNSSIWPIYITTEVGPEKLVLDIGSLVFYKGVELEHYREKYLGEWQTQVFMHFVDSEGPYTEDTNDEKNESLKPTPCSGENEVVQ
jgi:hypothetical protein